ncbi:unnamed protein product, partial [marine sediment metagenome]
KLHAWDTIKGSDFLCDQDVAMRFAEEIPKEILLLEHWGIPWSRSPDGRLAQRAFGGHSFNRAVFAADKTGFFEMQALYDTLQKYANVSRYDECYVTSILIKDNVFCGVTVWGLTSGEFFLIQGMVDKGNRHQVYANFKPWIMKECHGSFPDILALNTEKGCLYQMEYHEE